MGPSDTHRDQLLKPQALLLSVRLHLSVYNRKGKSVCLRTCCFNQCIYYSSLLQLDPIVTNAKQIGGLNRYPSTILKVGIYTSFNAVIFTKIQCLSSVDVERP